MLRINKIRILVIFVLGFSCQLIEAQEEQGVHQRSEEYVAPKDPLVKEKLSKWENQKFGMLIHWGIYSVPGIMESWNLNSEDWIERDSTIAYNDYKKWYWNLDKIFNPVNFDPESWADAAEDAGMKYVVFTTKHHDGFNMFDTQQTDYKITNGPFQNHPKANVAKYVFEAFRNKGFMIGAYFSKPDWHSQYFWWDKYATPNRNANYDIEKYDWRWNKFKEFSFNQISELMHDYGSIDILWLDGGWIRPKETVNDEVRAWGAPIPEASQEIDMPKIAEMAREAQPGIIFADRTVHGPYENYQTPERKIPETKLDVPWESCLPLGNNWGYVPNDPLKSPTTVIHNLIEVVAKGGNMLLGVGPKPDGTLPYEVVNILEKIGNWLDKNGEAIYHTNAIDNYQDGNVFFTENGKKLYAIAVFEDESQLPGTISWSKNLPSEKAKITLLETGEKVRYKIKGNKLEVVIPQKIRSTKNISAIAFLIEN
ncbi:alpha-L-fucosidase [Antarcticibacterium sp. 1MA-6-2]|uniref:alpha-L-fucosidase n=1 Tax=Antarcticibacterium sp. 1MA-6-2 TaxID=2908210 RepID=UPI001F2410D9|nr:alpha-L-fucosidase [Antarcticibacterium sp. 1MA-6-2]UJH90734.1 alpha-L-fucosidase [Antarcticibacterium sp. 1MA-6-2]